MHYILSDPKHADNLLSPEAIQTYFMHFQAQANREITKTPKGLDYELITLLDGTFASKQQRRTASTGMFKTIERYFEAIESPTIGVLVPYGKGKEIIAALNEESWDFTLFNQLMKQAQQYTVNLFEHELQKLSSNNLIEPLFNDSIYCLNEKAYNEHFGVTLEGQGTITNHIF